MPPLFAVGGLVAVAALTPGPNNLVVLATAARGGLRAALPAVAGVLLGSQLLLFLVWAGVGPLLEAAPFVRTALVVAGAVYLAALGALWIRRAEREPAVRAEALQSRRSGSFAGMAVFQFLNPKGWVLVLTVTAAMTEARAGLVGLGVLAVLFLVVFGTGLLLWASAGAALLRRLESPPTRRRFERAMGGLLIASAAFLFA